MQKESTEKLLEATIFTSGIEFIRCDSIGQATKENEVDRE
jgi:hypothetical protein